MVESSNLPSAYFVRPRVIKVSHHPVEGNGFPKYLLRNLHLLTERV